MTKMSAAKAEAAHQEQEAVAREISTLKVRLEYLEPAEAEAKAIRQRLRELAK
jgi:hypothetical protein